MAVDPSKLRRPSRRRLGAPPTDGSPGIEDDSGAHDSRIHPATSSPQEHADSASATVSVGATRMQSFNPHSPFTAMPQTMIPTAVSGQSRQGLDGTGKESGTQDTDHDGVSTTAWRGPATGTGTGRGDQPASQRRQRIPAPETEARIPFTTRVSASTKERLEDACHYLRVKHQDFINQAIVAHLKKHGF